MDITIQPGILSGTVSAIPSKSQAHRYLICAAFADQPTKLICPETNQDIEATADCLRLICQNISRTDYGYDITPCRYTDKPADTLYLNCHESGSTLRFLLPIAGALGRDVVFELEGRLPQRPLSPLWEEMQRMGCHLQFISENRLHCTGQLRAGDYYMDGGISSQFITGLLFALSLLEDDSRIHILGKLESRPYVDMTQYAMARFGVEADHFHIQGGQIYRSPGTIEVEGDWSNGAFWLAAQALGSPLAVTRLDPHSLQGDRAAQTLIPSLREHITISAADIPDLVPVLSVVAAANNGAVFTDIRRLRMKESDRVASVISMIENLGGKAEADENNLRIYGTGLRGGAVNACKDHRIAMSAAIAATICKDPVTILGAECVNKSYPAFWDEYRRLGGIYEQYLR